MLAMQGLLTAAEGWHLGLDSGLRRNNIRPFSLEIATARQRFLRTVYCPRGACQDQDVAPAVPHCRTIFMRASSRETSPAFGGRISSDS
jgi:hypothetical protein